MIGGLPMFGFLQGAPRDWQLVSTIRLIGIAVIIPTIVITRGKTFEPMLLAGLTRGPMTPEPRTAIDNRIVRLEHFHEQVAIVGIATWMVPRVL